MTAGPEAHFEEVGTTEHGKPKQPNGPEQSGDPRYAPPRSASWRERFTLT